MSKMIKKQIETKNELKKQVQNRENIMMARKKSNS
jgi:hypothetical protein